MNKFISIDESNISYIIHKYLSHWKEIIAASTLERWYYNYKRGGFDALIPKRRCDTGQPRKLDEDITEQIRF